MTEIRLWVLGMLVVPFVPPMVLTLLSCGEFGGRRQLGRGEASARLWREGVRPGET